jgi:diguanylate cyclase (GGDEF)-like protein
MNLLSLLDNRTLLACDGLISAVFAAMFLVMRREHRSIRGIDSISLSFLLYVPASLLLAARGEVPAFLSITVANGLVLVSGILLYRGVLDFVGSRRATVAPWVVALAALAVVLFCSEIEDRIVPRIVAMSLAGAFFRVSIAIELNRKAPEFSHPDVMRILAASMGIYATAAIHRAIMTFLHGSPPNLLKSDSIQTFWISLGFLTVCVNGLLLMVLMNGKLMAQSRDESQTDSLSGAFNRRGIEAALANELNRATRGGYGFAVALIDVDFFKSINDTQGHAAGDEVLRRVSKALTAALRSHDYLGRLGGDEFVILFPQTSAVEALEIAQRLGKTVRDLAIAGRRKPVTLSMGITDAVSDDDMTSLLARADEGLYQAKRDGRDCCRLAPARLHVPTAKSNFASITRIPETVIESPLIR